MDEPANNSKISESIITVDGPSGAGKGTLCQLLAKKLGWHLLDSGALYRVLGIAAHRHGICLSDIDELARIARDMDLYFKINEVSGEVEPFFEGSNLADFIRTDEAGQAASKVAALLPVREALLEKQRAFYQKPGLIADGRDMGTTVFPDSAVKVFLTASAECRAERRVEQLKSKGVSANMRAIFDSIKARDERDRTRKNSPLVPAKEALIVDSSNMTIDEVLSQVIEFAEKKLLAVK